ncbi:MAG: PmeII family type II restriction endonuclease [Ignavibacteriae bacterium]|nr:PmeII family type II restriction endonuclease [Ignavibacteriota bacterium]
MGKLVLNEVIKYIESNIGDFHKTRIENFKKLKLSNILKRKNPYLYKAKNFLTSHDIVKGLLDAHLSSQEETIFGEFLEGLAIFICNKVYKGKKSSAEGIDLEFQKDKIFYIVSIKSGPNWGNAGQITKMLQNFRTAKKRLKTNSKIGEIIAINGCCYGKNRIFEKEEYLKFCGQRFWEFISGNSELYLQIIEPLGNKAKEKNQEFFESYAQVINKFTSEFSNEFCFNDKIDWNKLVKFNSSK